MEQFFGSSSGPPLLTHWHKHTDKVPGEPATSTLSSVLASYMGPLEPYARPVLAFLGPLLPPLFDAIRTAIQLLSPLFHTLHLLLLSAASLTLTTVLKILYALPPSLTPLVVLVGLLLGLWIALSVMSLVRRATAFVMGLMFRLGLLGALIAMAWYVKERGVEESLRDLGWGVGVLRGWWEEGRELGDGRARDWERNAYGGKWDFATPRPRRW